MAGQNATHLLRSSGEIQQELRLTERMAPLPQTSLNKGENDALRPDFWSPHPREESLRALPAGIKGNAEAP
jgi:hypothetical protein